MNNYIFTGNLVKDPVKYESDAIPRVRFTVANNDDKEKPMFLDCVAFKRLAETCLQYISKGSKVLIRGRLSVYENEKDGKKYKNVEIICDQVDFLSQKNEQQPETPPTTPTETPEQKHAREQEEKLHHKDDNPDDLPF